MKFIFWQPTLTEHQAPLMRSLAKKCDVVVVAEKQIADVRSGLGWTLDYGEASVLVDPTEARVKELLDYEERDVVHVVSGLLVYPLVSRVTFELAKRRRRLIIYSEAPSRGRISRFPLYALRMWRVSDRAVERYLLTGSRAVRTFRMIGASRGKITPWMYFPEVGESRNRVEVEKVDLIFVGTLRRLKNVELLLRALADLKPEYRLSLTVVGDGPDGLRLRQLADALGVAEQINWVGEVPAEDVAQYLSYAGCLVLPSRDDGWGAVVNEALQMGCMAVVSDACGSSALAGTGLAVRVFKSGSLKDLKHCLQDYSSRVAVGGLAPAARNDRRRTARSLLNPKVGAQYLFNLAQAGPGVTLEEPAWKP